MQNPKESHAKCDRFSSDGVQRLHKHLIDLAVKQSYRSQSDVACVPAQDGWVSVCWPGYDGAIIDHSPLDLADLMMSNIVLEQPYIVRNTRQEDGGTQDAVKR